MKISKVHTKRRGPKWPYGLGSSRGEFNHTRFVAQLLKGCDRISPQEGSVILGILRNRDMTQLKEWCSRVSDPTLYGDPDRYFQFAQIVGVIKKYPFDCISSEQRAAEGLKKFRLSEETCRAVNRKFQGSWHRRPDGVLVYHEGYPNLPKRTMQILQLARKKVGRVLGKCDLAEVLAAAAHGPGVSLGFKGDMTTEIFKYGRSSWTSSETASRYFGLASLMDPLIPTDLVLQGCEYNRVTSVPKDTWTSRTIAVEQTFNSYLQKGAGRVMASRIKRRLRHDISDQGINQEAAFYASFGGYATLDMTSASDSIAYSVVSWLFADCPDWYTLLRDLRSNTYVLSKKGGGLSDPIEYQKWSSMGNGYTFPLETLVFSSIIYGVLCLHGMSSKAYYVYGDDCIVPEEIADEFIEILSQLGFTMNPAKSFIKGPFRESCGCDFWYGIDVRPFYLNFHPTRTTDFHFLVNSLFRLHNTDRTLDPTFAIEYCLSLLGDCTCYGPVVEDKRGHIMAPAFWLYKQNYLRYNKDYQCMEYKSVSEVALDYRELFQGGDPELLACFTSGRESAQNTLMLLGIRDLSREVSAREHLSGEWTSAVYDRGLFVGRKLQEAGVMITGRRRVRRVSRWVGFRKEAYNHPYFQAFWALR